MDMGEIVSKNPILAILRNVPLEQTMDYAGAVVEGGVRFFEVALNSKDGLKQISMLRRRCGERCMVGAGTAITVELAKKALEAGAQFLLTPGTPLDVMEYCAKNSVKLLPGVLTPSEVAVSLEYGYQTMKLFPAGSMPLNYVKSLKGPFDMAEFVAIGGVSPENCKEILASGYLGVGMASNLMPKEAVAKGDWEACAASVRKIVRGLASSNPGSAF